MTPDDYKQDINFERGPKVATMDDVNTGHEHHPEPVSTSKVEEVEVEYDGDYQNENAQGEFSNPYFVAADRWDKNDVPHDVRARWDIAEDNEFPEHWLTAATNNGLYPGHLPKLDPVVKAGWLEDLRSGTFNQCQSELKKRSDDGELQHCCLGVLYERFDGVTQEPKPNGVFLFKEPSVSPGGFTQHESMPGARLRQWAGLPYSVASVLAEANDSGSVSFADIADFIDKEM